MSRADHRPVTLQSKSAEHFHRVLRDHAGLGVAETACL